MKKYDTKIGESASKLITEFLEQYGNAQVSDLITLTDVIKSQLQALPGAEVHFSTKAWFKMQALIEECDKEIAWDGVVTRDAEKNNLFLVEDVIVYPQEVTGSTVNTDDEQYLIWMNSLSDEVFAHRRFNGHSHVNMGVSPSGVDTSYREESIKNIKDFFIYGIFNKKGDINMQIFDIENNIIYEDSDITVYSPTPDYSNWAKDIIKSSVKTTTYTIYNNNNKTGYGTGYGTSYGGYGNGGYSNGYTKPATTTAASTTTVTTSTTNTSTSDHVGKKNTDDIVTEKDVDDLLNELGYGDLGDLSK